VYSPVIKSDEKFSDKIDIDRLKTVIDEVYNGSSSGVIEELMSLGGSSGGARPKANIGYNPNTDELMHGYTILPEGFEHWIVKFPSSEDLKDIANIEYAYYKMALAADIEMSECRLLESASGQQVFATKRFDRNGNNRIHMHSMAGLTHDNFRMSSIDYGHIIDTAYTLENSASARKKILRLAAFNIYSHNRDDHSKNFSWLMDDSGTWTLAPAYDLTYSSTAIGEHSTRVAGEGSNPGRVHLMALAEEFSISKPSEIIEEVQEAIAQWPVIAKECRVSSESMNSIQKKFEQLRD
jgi:serine/threonine-protein kinase HipA